MTFLHKNNFQKTVLKRYYSLKHLSTDSLHELKRARMLSHYERKNLHIGI
jgi:hypothetical protein